MNNAVYNVLREMKWNLKTSFRSMFVVWNFWDFLFVHNHMGPRTARLWGGGKLYLRNYHDLQILLEIFENTYGVEELYPAVADIGANIGIFSVYYARRFPGASIEAFEPEPNNFNLLKKNTAPYRNITCHNVAVGSQSGKMTLYLDKKNLGRHSFYRGWVREKGEITVSVQPLGKLYDLIKMDTEGAEYDILKTIPDCKKLVMEIHDVQDQSRTELISRLSKSFRVSDLGGNVYSFVREQAIQKT